MAKHKHRQPTPPPPVKKKVTPTARQKARAATMRPAQLPGVWWFGLLAAGLGFLLYMNTFGHQYCLDDFSAIKENWVVKGGLKNIGTIFTTEYRYGAWNSPGTLYRPLALTMFAFEWSLSPDKPFLSHFMNVVFYALSGLVMWLTWRRILAAYPPALAAIAVILFMAHPVHTEVVANIKSRDEIASMLFCTIALYGIWRYLEEDRVNWLIGALVSYGLALFCKESSATFLFVFPLAIWFFTDKPLGKNLGTSALFGIPLVIFLMARGHALANQSGKEIFSILDNFMVESPPGERLASALMMCWRYLSTLIAPVTLVSDMGYPQTKPVGFNDWRAWMGLLTFGGMFIWALMNLGKKHFLSFAILFFLISFALFSNVLSFIKPEPPFTIGTSYGERLLYFPSLGFAFAVAWGILKVFKISDMREIWNPNGKGALVWGVAGALVALYSLKTVSRNGAWYDSGSLYDADVPTSPNCAKLNYHYGLELTKHGMDEKKGIVLDTSWVNKGIAQYSKAIELYPEYHDAFGSRGVAYFRLGEYYMGKNQRADAGIKFNMAETDYLKALKYRPNDAKVLSNMGYIYFLRNDLENAERVYRESLKYDPRFVDARRNLGAVMAMKKNFPAAIEQWQEGLKYDPNNATLLLYIGSAYRDMGKPEEGQAWFDKAYAIDPSLKK